MPPKECAKKSSKFIERQTYPLPQKFSFYGIKEGAYKLELRNQNIYRLEAIIAYFEMKNSPMFKNIFNS